MDYSADQSRPAQNWQHQATAFLARCRAQMWGKHKEEPLTWLHRAGFSLAFAQDHYLGWNFRSMFRKTALWLGEERGDEKYYLPRGLLLPWIQEQELLRLSILSPDGSLLLLEGSATAPMVSGKGPGLLLTLSDGDAFRLIQEKDSSTAVMAVPISPQAASIDFSDFGRIRLVAPANEENRAILAGLRERGRMAEAFWLPDKGLVGGILDGDLHPSDLSAMARFR
ncbi:hypothetical protein OOT00_06125 [Desulfobotulus sp. H1]|uniref:Uncharacterized protein n=1 Tax=Desulfobotulus pelophilus TaxID=2823377 RepID=A0ABT3N7Y5_9BACT|nr:hypothetical protein [Desulfobotulus pelophilus]MCW7753565.1 hypothetical protein [Desulfobotulus pelophilus]